MKTSRTLPERLTTDPKASPRRARSQASQSLRNKPSSGENRDINGTNTSLKLPPTRSRDETKRPQIDTSSKLDSMLECPICKGRYKVPKTLSCQHTFCLGCLESILDNESDVANRDKFRCPVCRSEQRIPKSGLEKLPTNVTVEALLDLHLPTEGADELPADMTQCLQCGSKGKLFVCMLHCNKLLCIHCHNRHGKQSRESARKLVNTLKQDLTRLNVLRNEWDTRRQNLMASHKQLKIDSEDFFNHAISTLKRMKSEVLLRSDKLVLPYLQGMDSVLKHLDGHMTDIETMTSDLEDYVLQKNDVDQWRLMRSKYEAQMKHSECQNIENHTGSFFTGDLKYRDRLVTKIWYRFSTEDFDEMCKGERYNKITFMSKPLFSPDGQADFQANF